MDPTPDQLSVRELKEILTKRGVDFSDCLEKADLVSKIAATADLDPLLISINKAADLLSKSQNIVVFSGAGMSVESGIPDFRSKGGLWEKFDPSIYASYQHFLEKPSDMWEMMSECNKVIDAAAPNKGHLALAELEKIGLLKAILTQNIDGLHQEAGNTNVFELHGGCKTATCLGCKKNYQISKIKEMLTQNPVPHCIDCGSDKVKVDVILFGEALSEGVMDKSIQAVTTCDLLIVIGSSLQVAPANMLPNLAKSHGAKILLLNLSPTPIDSQADVVVNGPGKKRKKKTEEKEKKKTKEKEKDKKKTKEKGRSKEKEKEKKRPTKNQKKKRRKTNKKKTKKRPASS